MTLYYPGADSPRHPAKSANGLLFEEQGHAAALADASAAHLASAPHVIALICERRAKQ